MSERWYPGKILGELKKAGESEVPQEFPCREIEVENGLDQDISFDLWYDKDEKKIFVKLNKPKYFPYDLPKYRYRLETLVSVKKR